MSYCWSTEQKVRPPSCENLPMSLIVCGASALSVAMLFYSWREYAHKVQEQQKKLRERVTYMLWVMAQTVPEGS